MVDAMNVVMKLLLALLSILIAIFFSLLFEGIDRKLHARMQNRIGPPVIQPFYDFIKLLNKERIVPITAASRIFTSAPIIAALCAVAGASIPIISILAQTPIIGDIILFLYLIAATSLMIMVGGSSSGNPYGAIGFSRLMTMALACKLPLFLSIMLVGLKAGTFSLHNLIQQQIKIEACLASTYPSIALSAATFLLCMPGAVGSIPFDIPDAKTEIAHGCLIEYGGPYLALIKLAKDAVNLALSLLASIIFFYTPTPSLGMFTLGKVLDIGFALVKALAFMFFSITIPRTIFARLKIGQAFKFYCMLPSTLMVLAIALFTMGV